MLSKFANENTLPSVSLTTGPGVSFTRSHSGEHGY